MTLTLIAVAARQNDFVCHITVIKLFHSPADFFFDQTRSVMWTGVIAKTEVDHNGRVLFCTFNEDATMTLCDVT